MKNLKLGMGLMLVVALGIQAASAQSGTLWPRHRSQDFLNVASITSSNAVGATNLSLPGVLGTNWLNTIWTNRAGRQFVSTASAYTNVNLLGSVELWSRGDGSPAFTGTNGVAGALGLNALGDANISYSISAGAGANTATTFIFKPSWDGTNVDTSGTYDFTFAVTPTASGTKNGVTNAPMDRWVGAKRLFAAVWVNGDTDATGLATLRSLKFNGFAPP
jgi:hypothetical protein